MTEKPKNGNDQGTGTVPSQENVVSVDFQRKNESSEVMVQVAIINGERVILEFDQPIDAFNMDVETASVLAHTLTEAVNKLRRG